MYKTLSTTRQGKYFKRAIAIAAGVFFIYAMWKSYLSLNLSLADVFRISIPTFLLIVLLTFFNLFCEYKKWSGLIHSPVLKPIAGLKAIVYGMSTGFLTPNRIGEFAGRAVVLPQEIRTKGSVMTFLGAGLQGAMTVIGGAIGIIFFPMEIYMPEIWVVNIKRLLFLIAVVLIVVIIIFFQKSLRRFIRKILSHLRSVNAGILIKSFFWAVLRYLVFSTQFVIALYSMGFSGDVATCYAGVAIVYLIQSYIPFAAMGELGVREVIAVLIFSPFMEIPVLAAVASFMVWVANVGVPVLLGAVYLRFSNSNTAIHD